MLHHSSSPIRLWIVGDKDGWEGFLAATKDVREAHDWLEVHFVDIFESEGYMKLMNRMPKNCTDFSSGKTT